MNRAAQSYLTYSHAIEPAAKARAEGPDSKFGIRIRGGISACCERQGPAVRRASIQCV